MGATGPVGHVGAKPSASAPPSLNRDSLPRPVTTQVLSTAFTRRSLLHAAPLLALLSLPHPSEAAASRIQPRIQLPSGPEVPADAAAYFARAVTDIAAQIGPEFRARLAIYGITPVLPSGVPGDPAKDYQSRRQGGSGVCGVFQPPRGPTDAPYALCPLPGEAPTDPTARDCCRHFAYAVPYSKLGFAVEDRVTTIVVSPRLFGLPPERWQAILAHELGHAADFYLFGQRYRLVSRQEWVTSPALRWRLADLDSGEADAELRADMLAEILLLEPRAQKLCYDPVLALQTLTEPTATCGGDGSGTELMRHYTHRPLQGNVIRGL